MAYCEEEGGDGLGAFPMRATAYMVPGRRGSILTDPRFRALREAAERKAAVKAAEKPPAISPTGAVPPPPTSPLDTYVPPTVRPRPDLTLMPSAPAPVLMAPAPISVSVTAPSAEPSEAAPAPRGFGMLEAAIAAGLAALLGAALARKGKGRR